MTSSRVALIGYGLAGSVFHAPLIHATSGLELSHIVTSSPQRSADARQRYPDAAVVPSVADVFTADVDAIVVATPNDSHAPLALRALENGLGVVIDKPMAVDSQQAEAVVRRAQETGSFCTVFQNRRWDGDFLTAARLIADGSLGGVHRLESRFERWRPVVDASRWRESADPALAGGLLFDLGSHLVDQAIVLLGPVVSVYAEVSARRAGAAIDDDVFLALTHIDGRVSHLWASALAAQTGPRLRVLGDRAAYVVHGLDPQEDQLRAGASPRDDGFGVYPESDWGLLGSDGDALPVPTQDGAYLDFYGGVARALAGGGPPPVAPAESLAVIRVLEAARASASEERVIRLGG